MKLERRTMIKVPEVTVFFWIIKVLTTGMGETTSDYFIHRVGLTNVLGLVVVTLVAGIALLICLVLQLSAGRYVAALYWLTVALVGVFGTMAADGVHAELGVPYLISSLVFAIVLVAVFLMWQRTEHTLSIHSIFTPRREVFYWMVVLTTFALGTAVGDMTAFTLHLGFLTSAVIFAGLIALPAVGFGLFGLNSVFAFWFAYIATRPLGASFADWFAAPRKLGGFGFGYGAVSLVVGVVIVGMVGYLTVTGGDAPTRSPA